MGKASKKHIIIVGAGFGGLAAAGILARQGYHVTVVDKNDQPGGRARMESAKDFHFDMGPSWYLMPEVFERFYNIFGTTANKELDLSLLNPGYAAFFGKQKLNVGKPTQTKKLFESIEQGAGKRLDTYLSYAKYQYETAMKEFIYKEYRHLRDFFTIRLLKEALSLNVFSSLHTYVNKQFKDHRLQKLLEYSMVFLGGSPKNTPALYSLMSHVDLTQGVWYPRGGLHQVAVSFEGLAKRFGAKFKYNTSVRQIIIKDGHAIGVKTDKGKYLADKVIVNADYAHAQLHLIDKKKISYSKRYWESRMIAPSAFIMYIGVKKKLPVLEHHNLFLADEWDAHFDQIFRRPRWPEDPSYYVCNPNKTEKRLAPPGHENLFFLVPLAAGLKDTTTLRKMMRDKILKDFQARIGRRIEKDIVYERCFAHKDFASYYNAYKGTALGLTHTMRQTAIFRPRHADKNIKNLYYTGQYTHPGIGVPMVIISSHILAERIVKEDE